MKVKPSPCLNVYVSISLSCLINQCKTRRVTYESSGKWAKPIFQQRMHFIPANNTHVCVSSPEIIIPHFPCKSQPSAGLLGFVSWKSALAMWPVFFTILLWTFVVEFITQYLFLHDDNITLVSMNPEESLEISVYSVFRHFLLSFIPTYHV